MGELRGASDGLQPPSTLVATDYLPDLEGRTFDKGSKSLDPAQRIAFKRAKLDIKIVKEAESAKTKYDLFDRLNSGGSVLSDQEFRNSLIVMTDPSFMDWLERLRAAEVFQEAVEPSDKQADEQYDLELVVRFIVLLNRDIAALSQFRDLRKLLTDSILAYAEDTTFDRGGQADQFTQTFSVLSTAVGGQAFRRYEPATDRFLGKFSVSAFEVISIGVASHLSVWKAASAAQLRARIASVWSDPEFTQYSGGGVPPTTRIPRAVALGRKLFATVD
jgi:hypothetical protein